MESAPSGPGTTYLLIDGENIDATLGTGILGRRPEGRERPRWDAVMHWAQGHWQQPVRGLFFLAARGDELPMPFIQMLMGNGYRPIPLVGRPEQKVVDLGIQLTMQALVERGGDVMLASHDGDFLDDLDELNDGRRLAVLGFHEFRNAGYASMVPPVELVDLEHDVHAFTTPLPRLRIIPIDEFDPLAFI